MYEIFFRSYRVVGMGSAASIGSWRRAGLACGEFGTTLALRLIIVVLLLTYSEHAAKYICFCSCGGGWGGGGGGFGVHGLTA